METVSSTYRNIPFKAIDDEWTDEIKGGSKDLLKLRTSNCKDLSSIWSFIRSSKYMFQIFTINYFTVSEIVKAWKLLQYWTQSWMQALDRDLARHVMKITFHSQRYCLVCIVGVPRKRFVLKAVASPTALDLTNFILNSILGGLIREDLQESRNLR